MMALAPNSGSRVGTGAASSETSPFFSVVDVESIDLATISGTIGVERRNLSNIVAIVENCCYLVRDEERIQKYSRV
jgi:hypothetical protein